MKGRWRKRVQEDRRRGR
jgi:hypothetical protein